MVAQARTAQAAWRRLPVSERVAVIGRFRALLAAQSTAMAELLPTNGAAAAGEKLATEILPLLDACRFLEDEAAQLLRPEMLGKEGRPAWLFGTEAEIRREPLGVILILAPWNYPLLLPGVQIVQALVAGNAVLVKPAPGCTKPLHFMAKLLLAAGLPHMLLVTLDEDEATGIAAIEAGIDKVVLTGSAETGRAVARRLAETLTPAVMELSGNDAMFVLPGADLDMAVRALLFGMRLNGGATCIAPRRVFCRAEEEAAIVARLEAALPSLAASHLPESLCRRVEAWLDEAARAGCLVRRSKAAVESGAFAPAVVSGARTDLALLREDVFAPVVTIIEVETEDEALALNAQCPYALGASIFGGQREAVRLAERIDAGSITINDVIVPTADPRLPFGGRRLSGFGVTRGGAGLLEMTAVKTVTLRKGRRRPHFDPPHANDAALFTAMITAFHAPSFGTRLRARIATAWRLIFRGPAQHP